MKLLDLATMLCSGFNLTDSQSGLCAYSRNAVQSIALSQDGTGAGSDILIRAAHNNLKIEETGIVVHYDGTHFSSKGPIRHGFDVIIFMLRLVSLKYPLWLFGILGLVFLVAAVALVLFTLHGANFTRALILIYAFEMFFLVGAGLFLSS